MEKFSVDLTKDGSGSTFTISYKKMFESKSLKYKGDVSPEPKLGVSTVGEKSDS